MNRREIVPFEFFDAIIKLLFQLCRFFRGVARASLSKNRIQPFYLKQTNILITYIHRSNNKYTLEQTSRKNVYCRGVYYDKSKCVLRWYCRLFSVDTFVRRPVILCINASDHRTFFITTNLPLPPLRFEFRKFQFYAPRTFMV